MLHVRKPEAHPLKLSVAQSRSRVTAVLRSDTQMQDHDGAEYFAIATREVVKTISEKCQVSISDTTVYTASSSTHGYGQVLGKMLNASRVKLQSAQGIYCTRLDVCTDPGVFVQLLHNISVLL